MNVKILANGTTRVERKIQDTTVRFDFDTGGLANVYVKRVDPFEQPYRVDPFEQPYWVEIRSTERATHMAALLWEFVQRRDMTEEWQREMDKGIHMDPDRNPHDERPFGETGE